MNVTSTPQRERINVRYKPFKVVYTYGGSQHEEYFSDAEKATKRADKVHGAGVDVTVYQKVFVEAEQAYYYTIYFQLEY